MQPDRGSAARTRTHVFMGRKLGAMLDRGSEYNATSARQVRVVDDRVRCGSRRSSIVRRARDPLQALADL